MKTKGEIEAEISRALVQFEINYMGRGPKEARTHIIEDMLVVRLPFGDAVALHGVVGRKRGASPRRLTFSLLGS